MWIITRYLGSNIAMFEFNTEKEARDALKTMKGVKILSEVGCSSIPNYKYKHGAA
ncbi:hypothetical protein P5G51_001100 [Virgibacillus sp. 179-BFC.A HS]|uniref:RRM domain-containing protein n=1 Tax=Tigheibacillus jepli TaxID=3035914 RepID=A0ABU5CEB0_9BACI|nr:hypothetical protein [Virgibacillus sp. 179-BFC.A HS]MDY0404187.1 hypothetical protein [Virgibacillus sp. 179-BFC.A HS]